MRADRLGPLVEDRHFPPDLLAHLDILKLAEDEAIVVADGPFDDAVAARLGVPEILVTLRLRGLPHLLRGRRRPCARGMAGATACRPPAPATCSPPVMSPIVQRAPIRAQAAERASELVAGELEKRRSVGVTRR